VGSITSRKIWPPIPSKRLKKRWEERYVLKNGKLVPRLVEVEQK
jgi:hypothetical protein